MTRTTAERLGDVRRLLDAASHVYAQRARLAAEIARTTGLSPAGVELGFASLELDASDAELEALVRAAGAARKVHVILSANVFVAPLRALALARAAASFVTVRPSPRDPVMTREIVAAANDASISVVSERDVAEADADVIAVYGRDATVDAVRARARTGVTVRGHGAGMGVAVVTRSAPLADAASALSWDVVAFDQRGCLSPRVVFVEGDAGRASAFARALDGELTVREERVPRGTLSPEERSDAVRWRDTAVFAGPVWSGAAHAVALAPDDSDGVDHADLASIPPPGRHVLVVAAEDERAMAARIGRLSRWVVAVGCDDPRRALGLAPRHARVSELGRMQRPRLDGPVDRRGTDPAV